MSVLSVSSTLKATISLLHHSFAHALMQKQLQKYIKIIYAFYSAHVKYGVHSRLNHSWSTAILPG